jgi:para-aminobenzoate synthetase component 1
MVSGFLRQSVEGHIDRFYKSWSHLFKENPPDLIWDEIIDQVITQNSLNNVTAAVKIVATRGDRETPPYNHTLLVMARPYVHRLTNKRREKRMKH